MLKSCSISRRRRVPGEPLEALREVPIADYAKRCGVDEHLIRAAARRIGGADGVAVFEDLGIQQAPNSTLPSYLNKLLWILTGNFGKPGTMYLHSSFAPLAGASAGGSGKSSGGRRTPPCASCGVRWRGPRASRSAPSSRSWSRRLRSRRSSPPSPTARST